MYILMVTLPTGEELVVHDYTNEVKASTSDDRAVLDEKMEAMARSFPMNKYWIGRIDPVKY